MMHASKTSRLTANDTIAGRIPDTAALSGVIRTLPVFSGEIRTLKGVKTAK